jgi:thioesterase domain-containing protein
MKTNSNSVAESDVGQFTQPATEKSSASFWTTARTNLRLRYQSPPIQPRVRQATIPLSFNQERLWQLEQIQPGSSVYNLLHLLRLVGSLNLDALKRSLCEIAKRHESLRTSFQVVDGQPVQVISPDIDIHLSEIDLQELSPEQQVSEIQRCAIQQAEELFDLTQAPLWRVQLLRLSAEEHILLRTAHHIIFDGWSHTVFIRELGALYEAFSMSEASPLRDLPVQYADFAQTQRQWLQGEVLSEQLNYWQQQLGGSVAPLELPTDYPRSTSLSYRGASQSLVLPERLTEALKTLSSRQGVSLYITLLTAFKTLLYQYTEQQDILICSPVAGRHRPETRGLIGYFNNVVVMRTDLSGNPTLRDLLERVSQVNNGATEHQDAPFQKLSELPNLLRTPLTRAMFVLYNASMPFSGFLPYTLELKGLTIHSHFENREIANFDLSLLAQEQDGQLTAILQYKTDLFKCATIEEMLENFQTLLESLVANPGQALSDLPRFSSLADSEINQNPQPSPSVPAESFVAPRSELERQLVKIWEQLFGVHPIGVKDNFFELGGHSLLAVRLFAQIEQSLGVNVPLASLLQAPIIEQLARVLRQDNYAEFRSVLVPIQTKGTKPPLFCIHGAGLNVLIYKDLANNLGSDYPVYGVQAYMPDGSVPHLKDMDQVVSYYLQEIRRCQPEGPYFLAGLSKGGNFALKIAQLLRAQGQEIALVAMFDSHGLNAIKLLPPLPRLLSSLRYVLRYSLPRFLTKLQKSGIQALLTQTKPMRNSRVEDRKPPKEGDRQLNNTQAFRSPVFSPGFKFEVLEQWMDRISQYILEHSSWAKVLDPLWGVDVTDGSTVSAHLKQLRDAYEAICKSESHEVYDGQIALFRAEEDPPGYYIDPYLGWNAIAKRGVEVYKIPGDHISLVKSEVLANKLKVCIDRAIDRYSIQAN